VDLLALDDPVYVIELTAAALEACRRDLLGVRSEGDADGGAAAGRTLEPPPARPVRALALIFAADEDPLLLPIEPTRDMAALDAAARLIRAAAVTGRPLAELATDCGDLQLQRLYFARRLPRLIYQGVSPEQARRIPERFRTIVAGPRSGASG